MSQSTTRRGRPARHYRIRVRTERRDPIDFAALAQAALEQAAMDQRRDDDTTTDLPRAHPDVSPSRKRHDTSEQPSKSASGSAGEPS